MTAPALLPGLGPAVRTVGAGGALRSVARHRHLLWQLTRREIAARYRGSLLGFLWSFLIPVLMLAVYTFVFSVAFQARWPGATTSRTEFALILFSGLVVFTLFTEPLIRSPNLIVAQPNYVKKIVFPLEILPCVAVAAAMFNAAVGFAILVLASMVLHGGLPWTAMLVPLVLLPLVPLCLGLSWLLAALGVFVRDISPLVGLLTQVLLFMTPVFYPLAAIPQPYRRIVGLNPLAVAVEQVRGLVFYGRAPDWPALAVVTAAGLAAGWLGLAFFQRTRSAFANVL
jgi:lipopolysaccharide transport system permease protein